MTRESGSSPVKTIYLGNLPAGVSEEDVRDLCGRFGEVAHVLLVREPETGRPRGFGFVKMAPEAADRAIDELDGAEFGGSTLRANEARDRGAKAPRRSW